MNTSLGGAHSSKGINTLSNVTLEHNNDLQPYLPQGPFVKFVSGLKEMIALELNRAILYSLMPTTLI